MVLLLISEGRYLESWAARSRLILSFPWSRPQGRATRPSAQVVAALCQALRLPETDAALLHQAAGLAAPTVAISREVPASIGRLVQHLDDHPVGIYSADWWLLRWNDLWSALLGDPDLLEGRARNLVWYEFTDTPGRVTMTDAQRTVFRDALVADLRVAAIEHPDDDGLGQLLADLRDRSSDFAARWDTARPMRHRSIPKVIDHPRVGTLVLESDVLHAPGSELHIIAYSAEPGTGDADHLNQLRGAQLSLT
jgi:MmyB-like transcription regulator ligand binding domain